MGEWALLLVDIQQDFFDEIVGHFPHYGEHVARLLHFCREIAMPVVHVRAEFQPDMSDWMIRYRRKGTIPCIAGTPGAQVMDFARPSQKEPALVKKRFSAFHGTDLDHLLRTQEIETLVIGGLVTSVCVALTAADAYQRDYAPLIIRECVADEPPRHQAWLEYLDGFIGEVMSLEHFLAHAARWRAEDAVRPSDTLYDFARFRKQGSQ